ncbi:uncharacterized protein LOC143259078 [Megalopta genalis]|uniref:uncharacterized protein LOC143259078 n=1 Tax=Megalopta genalis TaxID=115081 RepID=UPI003FCF150F
MAQTSPRALMERQRSPREFCVADVVSDIKPEFDQRSRQDREIYNEPQYVMNVSRSPRNSLVPDDYYRAPSNGGRRPRHSLVPETGFPPEMVYGSRHAIYDASLSPRNSLVPDVVYNRSPRNSMVQLNGSRTSLMSENGNPVVSKSPRPSISLSASRCPRGSITNVELVDRSPQRSPRESIVAETINAPKNLSRSPRGSIGTGAHEDDARTMRRIVEPEIISRTPRGSVGGLSDRQTPKANLMLQDPRRASADQGATNTRTMKSAISVHQTNHGYGSGFEDNRRDSSSVSQLSGDESRRLFNNGVKAPDEKVENSTYNAITYGSVVFQLKDANIEARNTIVFVFRALKVMWRTRIVSIYLILLCILPIAMLIYGLKFNDKCPRKVEIPTYMILGGVFGTIFMFLITYSQIRSRRREILTLQPPDSQISCFSIGVGVLSVFLLVWFGMGNKWILTIMWPRFKVERYKPDEYCDQNLYIFALVQLAIVYVTFAIVIFVMFVMASLRILGWWLPER